MAVEDYPLKRKIELAFVSYLESKAEFSGVNIIDGGDIVTSPDLPVLSVYADSEVNDDTSPFEAGLRSVTLRLRYEDNYKDTSKVVIDERVGCLEYIMEDLDAIQAALNKTAEPDQRTYQGLHIYDVYLTNQITDQMDSNWLEDIEYAIVCGEHDDGNYGSETGDKSEGKIILRNGFADYNNTGSPIAINENEWVTLPNDGAGAFTNKNHLPSNVTELMNVADGSIDASELNLGDTILVRNDFSINPSINNALLELRYTLGNGDGAYTLETVLGRLDNGSGQDYRFSLKPDLIYMGDENTKNNPITIQIKLSSSGTLSNSGSVIQVIRR